MRYTGPKNRLARKESVDLGLKTAGTKSHAGLLKRLNVLPGQHGTRMRRKISQRRRQLSEKQKLCYMFGISEGRLKGYFKAVSSRPGNAVLLLCQLLETRLDNVVYRLGLAPTRAAARQLVSHGHIKVNGKEVNIPSYLLKVDDLVSFVRETSIQIPHIKSSLERKSDFAVPWIAREGVVGKMIAVPDASLVEKQVDLRQVIEYYSR